MLHHLHHSYISYAVNIDNLLVFKGSSQDIVQTRERSAVLSQVRAKTPCSQPSPLWWLVTGSEGEETLLPVNAGVYAELPGW